MGNDLGNKEIMARNIKRLMERDGKSRQEVCQGIGVSYTTFTDWVKGNTYPRIDKIEALANYFHVTKADLVEESTDDAPAYYLNDDARDAAEFLLHHPEYKVLFDASRKVKKEDIDFVAAMLERMNH